MADNSLQTQGDSLIKSLEDVYKNAPHLPANIREVLVKIAPWIALIFGILGILGGLGEIGVSPVAALGGVRNTALLLISGVLTIIASVLMVLAFTKLQKNQYAGWRLLFWSELINFVTGLLALSVGGIIGAIIGAAIGFYVLFEIKSYYK